MKPIHNQFNSGSMSAEYRYSNYTPKGWIIKKATEAYAFAGGNERLNLAALEAAIWAAFDAANEIKP